MMKRIGLPRLLACLLILLFVMALAACQRQPTAEPTAGAPPTTPASPPAATSTAPAVKPTTTGPAEGPLAAVIEAARERAAQDIGLPVDAIIVAETTLLPGADACLGVYAPGSACYRVRFEASDMTWAMHINEQGDMRPVTDSPRPEPGEAVLTWGADQCQVAALGREGSPVAIGPCQSEFGPFHYAQDEAAITAQFDHLLGRYAPFDAITAAGFLSFGGQGQAEPTLAEQRMVAEWVQYIAETAAAGQDDLPERLLLTWQREGGIAGFCNTLNVYLTGFVQAYQACGELPADATPAATGFLAADQAAQLFDWHDSLPSFEYVNADPATADAMTITYVFRGAAGVDTVEPADEVKNAIDLFTADLFTDVMSRPPAASNGFCPEVPRPAMVMFDGRDYFVVDPANGDRCLLDFPGETAAGVQVAGGAVYYAEYGGESSGGQVWRWAADGAPEPLPFTRAEQVTSNLLGFRVSDDGRFIAWSAGRGGADSTTSDLWVAAVDGSGQVALVSDQPSEGNRMLMPIRFGADGTTVYYALQPFGIGGAWPSFTGRYDSVFAIPVTGGEPLLHADCPTEGLFMCVGDVTAYGTVAYTDVNTNEIVVRDRDGGVISRIAYQAEYAGYPTFSPGAHLAFYSAEVVDDPEAGVPVAAPGNLYFIGSPYQAEPGLLASADGVGQPIAWVGNQLIAFNLSATPFQWGTAVASIDGDYQPIEPWPPAAGEAGLQFVAVWLEPVLSAEMISKFTLETTRSSSPDGAWEVEVAISEPFAVRPGEQEKVYYRLTASNEGTGTSYTVIEEIGNYGLGNTYPAPFFWSADGQRLYVTNIPLVDGCPGAVNGSDLLRVDLDTGQVTEIIPKVGLFIALSPDESRLAYQAYGGRLVVRELSTGAEWELGPATQVESLADLRWAPDGRGLLLVGTQMACLPPEEQLTSLVWIDPAARTARVLVEDVAGLYSVQEWREPDVVELESDGRLWSLDLTTGALTES